MIKETEPEKQYSEFAKYSFYNYIGVFIGVFSNLFIYTTNEEFLGVVRYTESLAFLILLVCQDKIGAMLISRNPGIIIGITVELKYGPPTDILSLVKTSTIIG